MTTTIARFDPFRELSTLADQLLRSPQSPSQVGAWVPPVDVIETPDAILIRADLPGVTTDAIELGFEDNVLSLRGERQNVQPEERSGYFRVERPFGRFARSIALPTGISPEGIEAHFTNGVLEVRVPKAEQAKARRIAIS